MLSPGTIVGWTSTLIVGPRALGAALGSTPGRASAGSSSGWRTRGYDLQLTRQRRARLARDLLHDRDGALAHERDRHRMGAHAMARDAASRWEALTKADAEG